MTNEFMREEHYIVFKMPDLGNSLKGDEIRRLAREYAEHLEQFVKKPLDYVVVGAGWSEYSPALRVIEVHVTGAQPAPSIKDAIIDDLQSQFDSEGITEHDSGDALIRLSDAIAAVEDNFVQSAQSVPDGWKLVPIEPTQEMINRVIDERLDALAAGKDHTFIDIYKAMLAAAPKPEAKP